MSAHNLIVEDFYRHTSTCMALLSFSLFSSLTQDWTGGVHSYFEMTKDPQPATDKYGPHTFCSGHVCTAVISPFY